jgi:hypothetical protein
MNSTKEIESSTVFALVATWVGTFVLLAIVITLMWRATN